MFLLSSSFFLGSMIFGLVTISSSFVKESKLEPSAEAVDVEAAPTSTPDKGSPSPIPKLGKLIMTILSMITVGYAVSISMTNNLPMELTEPHWYIVDGQLDTPPPEVLKTKETMVITFERHPNFIKGAFGTKGFLTYKMGTSFLVVFWSSMPAYNNRLMVKIVNQDPNPAIAADPEKLYDQYFKDGWEIGDYGKWFFGINQNIKCKFVTSMGNGRKAPLEIYLTPS